MSYEKVKSIKIDEEQGKVFINCASNNVRPLLYTLEEYPYFSKILKEQGKEAVEIALLESYEGGNLQDGVNKYTKALKVLFYVFADEYHKFDWRNDGEEYEKAKELRKTPAFKELLKKALNYKFPKEKYIITKDNYGEKVFGKRCPTCMKWSRYKEKATKYDFEAEAKDNIFEAFKDVWKVEVLK